MSFAVTVLASPLNAFGTLFPSLSEKWSPLGAVSYLIEDKHKAPWGAETDSSSQNRSLAACLESITWNILSVIYHRPWSGAGGSCKQPLEMDLFSCYFQSSIIRWDVGLYIWSVITWTGSKTVTWCKILLRRGGQPQTRIHTLTLFNSSILLISSGLLDEFSK